jgi:hypothetical protein
VATSALGRRIQNGNVGIGTDSPTAQLTLGASSGSQIAVTDNTRLLSNTHYLQYASATPSDFEQVLLQFDTGGTGDSDQSEYAGYIDVEMVAQRTTSTYYGPEIFTARLNYVLGWNEASNLWIFTTFVQENKSVSNGTADGFTVFRSVPVFKYKYVDRQLQVYVSFNANWFRGYTSFTARVTSDAPADVSMPGSDALMASGTVGTAEIGMCYGYGAYAANVGIGTTNPGYKLDVNGSTKLGKTGCNTNPGSEALKAFNFNSDAAYFESDHELGLVSIVRAQPSTGASYNSSSSYFLNAVYRADLDATSSTNWKYFSGNRDETNEFYVKSGGNAYFAGNVGIGVTNPTRSLQIERGISYISGGTSNNSAFEIVQQLGTDDYTFNGQHRAQFRIKSGLGTYSNRSLELALLDNGRGIMQASAASEGYFPISINPKGDYNSTVSIGSYYSSAKLRVEGNVYATSDLTTSARIGAGVYTSLSNKLQVAGTTASQKFNSYYHTTGTITGNQTYSLAVGQWTKAWDPAAGQSNQTILNGYYFVTVERRDGNQYERALGWMYVGGYPPTGVYVWSAGSFNTVGGLSISASNNELDIGNLGEPAFPGGYPTSYQIEITKISGYVSSNDYIG